jgi:hypothetical protein
MRIMQLLTEPMSAIITNAKTINFKTSLLREIKQLRHFPAGDDGNSPVDAIPCDSATGERKQGKITATSDIQAGMKPRAALAHQYASGAHKLPSGFFYAQAFPATITPILRSSLSFFVCHDISSKRITALLPLF